LLRAIKVRAIEIVWSLHFWIIVLNFLRA
jgi:hypothetical protein